MATSIYATPPPDLSGEETALSDVSNSSSSLNNRNSNSVSVNVSVSGNTSSNTTSNTTSTLTNTTNTNTNTSTNSTTSTSQLTTPTNNMTNKSNINNSTNNNNNNNNNHTSNDATTSVVNAPEIVIATVAAKKPKRSISDFLPDSNLKNQKNTAEQHDRMSNTNTNMDIEHEIRSSTNVSEAIIESNDVDEAINADINSMTTQQNASTAMAAMAVAANAAMQLQLLEAINDAAKKRRKQNNPSRLEALNLSGDLNSAIDSSSSTTITTTAGTTTTTAAGIDCALQIDGDGNYQQKISSSTSTSPTTSSTVPIDYEDKLSKMFLPKSMEQLKETFELLQQQQQLQKFPSISPTTHTEDTATGKDTMNSASEKIPSESMMEDNDELKNPYRTFCKECGENFETDLKLGLHMLQEHTTNCSNHSNNTYNPIITDDEHRQRQQQQQQKMKMQIQESFGNNFGTIKVKTERLFNNSPQSQSPQSADIDADADADADPDADHRTESSRTQQMLNNGGKEQWLNTLPGMTFPFPPEAAAAAALSAGAYLPLLGVAGFPGMESLNRPPLRIFNPEAYCDLCNKEFCNKYFLKTHKANKHGIYDPAGSGEPSNVASNAATSNPTMSTIFHLQMQQQQQQQQVQQQLQQQQQQQKQQFESQTQQPNPLNEVQVQVPKSNAVQTPLNIPQQTPSSPVPQPVFCEICSKRFTNVFAMRRHRSKVHEQAATSQRTSPNEQLQSIKRETHTSSLQQSPKTEKSNSTAATTSGGAENATFGGGGGGAGAGAGTGTVKPFRLPDDFCQDFTLEQEEVAFTPQPRKLSPLLQQQAREANFAHDKLKRLGVLNPEAFCEICCKEYCNKYFLRTHKWKRHGIFVPPDEFKDDQMTAVTSKIPWPFLNMANVPLNLMMNEKIIADQRAYAPAPVPANDLNQTLNETADESIARHAKRIKLEITDDDEPNRFNDENQSEKQNSERNTSPLNQQQQQHQQQNVQMENIPSTPEPSSSQKLLPEMLNAAATSTMPSSEAAMGLQNLQKLQSMILQLNDLNGKRPMTCHLCGRKVENQYALHIHIMTEHVGGVGVGVGGGSNETSNSMPLSFQQHILQQQQQVLKISPTGSPASTQPNNELRCNPCERDFSSLLEFKQHIAEVHLLSNSPLRDGFITPERPINPNPAITRPPYTITPTSSYCEICNKELCNKYFMKTHMQRMHGIEIENGAQIGGVVCNICNKELCSKYFLRVHKHNTHGIIEEGSPLPQPRQNGLGFEQQQQQQQHQQHQSQQQQQQLLDNESSRGLNLSPFGGGAVAVAGAGANVAIPADIKAESMDNTRFYNNWTETCPICTRRFRNLKWLRGHLMSDHGTAGIEKLREIEQQYGSGNSGILSKPTSPTLKIPNGSGATNAVQSPSLVPNTANLAQALQNLNTQHLLANMPKSAVLPGMFGAIAEQALQPPRLKEYQCSVCPFTTPYYAFLFIHERTHTMPNNMETETETEMETEMDNGEAVIDNDVKDSVPIDFVKVETTHSPIDIKDTFNQNSTHHFTSSTFNDIGNDEKKSNGEEATTNIDFLQSIGTGTSTIGASFAVVAADSTKLSKHESATSTTISTTTPTATRTTKSIVATTETVTSTIDAGESKSNISTQSIGTSPIRSPSLSNISILDVLSAVANKHQQTACYAVPKDIPNNNDEQQMQAFILKADDNSNSSSSNSNSNSNSHHHHHDIQNGNNTAKRDDLSPGASNRFVPAIIYLPVRERISEPVTVTFTLRPT